MKCNNCNSEIDESVRFCPVCGTKVEQDDSPPVNSTVFQRDPCRFELEAILPDLKLLEEKYRKVEQIGKAQNYLEKEYKWYRVGVGILVFAFSMPLLLTLHVPEYCVPFVSLLLAVFSAKAFEKKLIPSKEQAKQKYDEEIEQYKEQYLEYYKKVYPMLSKWLPEDYWYLTAVQSITTYFKNNRADSLKEALNLYEEEMYRLRMENMQENILRENEKQTALAALTAFSTSIIAFTSLTED